MVLYRDIIEQLESYYPNNKEYFAIYYSFEIKKYHTMIHVQPPQIIHVKYRQFILVKIISSNDIKNALEKSTGIYDALYYVYPKSEHDNIKYYPYNCNTIDNINVKCCGVGLSSYQVKCPICKKPVRRSHTVQTQPFSLSLVMDQFIRDVELLTVDIKQKRSKTNYLGLGIGIISTLLLGDMIMDGTVPDVPDHSHGIPHELNFERSSLYYTT